MQIPFPRPHIISGMFLALFLFKGRHYYKFMQIFMQYVCWPLKLECGRVIVSVIHSIKFHEDQSSGS